MPQGRGLFGLDSFDALYSDRSIRDASLTVYAGLPPHLRHEVDEFLRGMIGGVAPRLEKFDQELYDAYAPVRRLVHKRYGAQVTLYRGEPRNKPVLRRRFLSWTPSWIMATRFAGDLDHEIVEADVPVSDVVAVFVSPHNDAYIEYLVQDRPEYHKQSENQVPWVGYITTDAEGRDLGYPEETVLHGRRGYWNFDPDHARKEFAKIERALKSVGGKILKKYINEEDEGAGVTVVLPGDVKTQNVRGDLMSRVGPYWVETLRKYTGYEYR